MNARIKVCCISTVSEATAAIDAGADAIGLVGKMPSGPGQLADEAIRTIAATIPPGVDSFLLTSETEPASVVDHVVRCRTSVVQLVDAVPDDTYRALREACPNVRIVQVVHVESERALDTALRVPGMVDAVLLDSGRPSAPDRSLGGTGETHDWTVSARIVDALSVRVFLAGGLNSSNVEEAVSTVQPFGVDICSGVRTDNRLDVGMLGSFVEAVRRADRAGAD